VAQFVADYCFGARLAVVFLAAGLAFVDRAPVFGAVFFAAAALVAAHFLGDRLQPAFMAAVGLAVPFAFGERFALAVSVVVFVAAFGLFAIYHGSSVVDALF
jgi:hypothetical protein